MYNITGHYYYCSRRWDYSSALTASLLPSSQLPRFQLPHSDFQRHEKAARLNTYPASRTFSIRQVSCSWRTDLETNLNSQFRRVKMNHSRTYVRYCAGYRKTRQQFFCFIKSLAEFYAYLYGYKTIKDLKHGRSFYTAQRLLINHENSGSQERTCHADWTLHM